MRLAFYQFAPELGAVEKNRERLATALHGLDADLIVLPELATTGYLFTSREELFRQAEPVPGPTTDLLQRCAAASGAHIVLGIAERVDGRCYNLSLIHI